MLRRLRAVALLIVSILVLNPILYPSVVYGDIDSKPRIIEIFNSIYQYFLGPKKLPYIRQSVKNQSWPQQKVEPERDNHEWLKNPDFRGSILGATKDFIYTQEAPDKILQWDSTGKTLEIPLGGELAGFTTYDRIVVVAVQGVGLVFLNEAANLKEPTNRSIERVGNNQFSENGMTRYHSPFSGDGIVIHESTRIYKEGFRGRRFILDVDGLIAAARRGGNGLSQESWWVNVNSTEGRILRDKSQTTIINKYLGANSDRLAFMIGPTLFILQIPLDDSPSQIQYFPESQNIQSFSVQENDLYLFKGDSMETYDLSKNNLEIKGWPLWLGTTRLSDTIPTVEQCSDEMTALSRKL